MSTTSVRENQVREMIDFWLPRLGLHDWVIDISISDCFSKEDKNTEATVVSDIKYHQASIEVFKPFWKSDKKGRYRIIAHELSHLLLCRLEPHMSPSGDDVLEEVIQTITMLFYKNHAHEI